MTKARRGSTAPMPPRSRLTAFDGLRAVAALSVLAYHVGLAEGLSRRGMMAPFIAELKAGVAVFFVISGCLLYLPYARALCTGGPLPDWRGYAHRRALRILPGYWVALTILALGPLAASVITPNWWRYYALAQIYNSDTVMGGLGVAWSLCVEVSFYAMLPLLAIAVARLARAQRRTTAVGVQAAVLALLAICSVAIRFVLAGSVAAPIPHSGFVTATALTGFLDWFAAGMGLALLTSVWESGGRRLWWVAQLAARSTTCWALALAAFTAGALAQGGDLFLPLAGLTAHLAAGLGALLIVLPAVAPDQADAPAGVLRILRHPLALWLGAVSYGIYLWHVPLLQAIHGPLAGVPAHPADLMSAVGLLVLVTAGAIVLGAASWYLVEQPARRLFAPARKLEPVVARG